MDSHEPAGETKWLFPDLGEESPTRSDTEVFVLTAGGIAIRSHWDAKNPFYIAWARFPKRDRAKEALVAEARTQRRLGVQSPPTRREDHGGPDEGARYPQSSSS